MLNRRTILAAVSCLALCLLASGCDKAASNAKPAAPAGGPAKPVASAPKAEPVRPTGGDARPTAAGGAAAKPAAGGELKLAGLTMTVPDGWVAEQAAPGPMAPVAVFSLPKVEGDAADCSVRITFFPGMKGKDDINIDRWLNMVTQADGKPHTRETAKLTTTTIDHVRLTTVDMSGTVDSGMGGGEMEMKDSRQIAAIVDHPRGPHYVKVFGPAKSMEKWAGSIEAFLKSAKAGE